MLGNSTEIDGSLNSFQQDSIKLENMRAVVIYVSSSILCFYTTCKHTKISENIIYLACFVHAQNR